MDFNLNKLKKIYSDLGCSKILAKPLAENDNSKNQVYLGMSFDVLNVFPNLDIQPSKMIKSVGFKAPLSFFWVSHDGDKEKAPHAQLILYPQYPEVRFSGFLKGCKLAPSDLMTKRSKDRVLFLGVRDDGCIYGYVTTLNSMIGKEYRSLKGLNKSSVFDLLPIDVKSKDKDSKLILLKNLRIIFEKGWINSKRLDGRGNVLPCKAPNCGGFTLEAELGIRPNGFSEPDFMGWEVKQHAVTNFNRYTAGPITLMTPEPNGGEYCEKGVDYFVHKYGYIDTKGRPDRMNFGGIYKANHCHSKTNLTLKLIGYNHSKGITDANGYIALINSRNKITASWTFTGLMKHWNKKHSKAVYVPSLVQQLPLQYKYGQFVNIGEGADFLELLKAFDAGSVYYDPGIKIENISTAKPKVKRRSQFRINYNQLQDIYKGGLSKVDLLQF